MPLNIKTKPQAVVKEILLPSAGYPYQDHIPGGRLLINAFDWDAERTLFKGVSEPGNKEMLRYVEVANHICHFPKGFTAENLLEGDLQYILLEGRSLSYGEDYKFTTTCPECKKDEEANVKVPAHLPCNRFPSDFSGVAHLTTTESNIVGVRFLTAREEMDCENLTRQRIAKKVIEKNRYEDDLALTRLCKHIVSVNDGKPDSLEELRKWVKSIRVTEKSEILAFINHIAPGVNYRLEMECPECHSSYKILMPIGADFFRAGTQPNAEQLPPGVRIGVFGPDERSEVTPSSGEDVPVGDTSRVPGGEEQQGAKAH
jgi:hypothetical protein